MFATPSSHVPTPKKVSSTKKVVVGDTRIFGATPASVLQMQAYQMQADRVAKMHELEKKNMLFENLMLYRCAEDF